MEGHSEQNDEQLAALALADFEAREQQVVAIQQKARSLLTVNALLVTSGVISALSPSPAGGVVGATLLTSMVSVLAVLVGISVFLLLQVDSAEVYAGPPTASSTIPLLRGKTRAHTARTLAVYYARAATKNGAIAAKKADTLRSAVGCTLVAGAVFILTLVVRVVTSMLRF